MWEDLLVWLMAVYGCSSLLASLLERWAVRPESDESQPIIHYRLLLANSEQWLEGVVRRLLLASRMGGTPIRISFVDCGSTDDTARIAAVFARREAYVVTDSHLSADEHERLVCIDLRKPVHQEQGI
ncbi:MAG: glycosyltransferase [Brevibacillus sp.]|nr:glycosyltransferase [Brevibacillus sp.]